MNLEPGVYEVTKAPPDSPFQVGEWIDVGEEGEHDHRQLMHQHCVSIDDEDCDVYDTDILQDHKLTYVAFRERRK